MGLLRIHKRGFPACRFDSLSVRTRQRWTLSERDSLAVTFRCAWATVCRAWPPRPASGFPWSTGFVALEVAGRWGRWAELRCPPLFRFLRREARLLSDPRCHL